MEATLNGLQDVDSQTVRLVAWPSGPIDRPKSPDLALRNRVPLDEKIAVFKFVANLVDEFEHLLGVPSLTQNDQKFHGNAPSHALLREELMAVL
jgi:hypothetical protein